MQHNLPTIEPPKLGEWKVSAYDRRGDLKRFTVKATDKANAERFAIELCTSQRWTFDSVNYMGELKL